MENEAENYCLVAIHHYFQRQSNF
uniref:Uncharacterized protein n=1 Tax=Ciona intestinalis TaxID=7719 RepID=H2XKU7_CIOIN